MCVTAAGLAAAAEWFRHQTAHRRRVGWLVHLDRDGRQLPVAVDVHTGAGRAAAQRHMGINRDIGE